MRVNTPVNRGLPVVMVDLKKGAHLECDPVLGEQWVLQLEVSVSRRQLQQATQLIGDPGIVILAPHTFRPKQQQQQQ